MIAVITLWGIIAFALSFAMSRKNMRILDLAVWSLTIWFFCYIISTTALVMINCFSITRAALSTSIIASVVAVICNFKTSGIKNIKIELGTRKCLASFIVSVLVGILVSVSPFSYGGMGQDEGVYQTEALCYINGMNERQFDYDEYYKLANTSLQDEYIEQVQTAPNIAGAYPYADFNNISEVLTGVRRGCISEYSSGFHGLHTFSALLALWGSIFGISNMNGINALLLALCVCWLIKICSTLKLNFIGTSAAVICTVMCPQIIWSTKSALTEPGLTLIWLLLIYALITREKQGVKLSSLCILVYGCYHVSLYVFMPLFAFLYLALFFYTADKAYLKGLLLSGCAFLYTLWYSLITACKYTLYNFDPVLKSFLTRENIAIFASIAGLALILIASLMLFVYRKKNNKKLSLIAGSMNSQRGITIMGWIIRIVTVVILMYFAYRFLTHKANSEIYTYNTIVAFAYLSGITFFLFALYQLVIGANKLSSSRDGLVMATLFIYCIFVYSIAFKKEINYFYYYSRYLTMYVPIIALMAGIAISKLTADYKSTSGKVKYSIAVVASIVGICIIFPHAKFVISNQDDSRYDWDNITSVNELVKTENISAAFIRPDLFTAYYYDLKSIGVDVYPITDDFEVAYDEISAWYDGVIIIDGVNPYDYQPDGTCTYESHAANAGYPIITSLTNTMTEDLGFYRDARTALPNSMYTASYEIVIYRYK